jgi:hypothetical protein
MMHLARRHVTGRAPDRIGHGALKRNRLVRRADREVGRGFGRPAKGVAVGERRVVGKNGQREKLLVPAFRPRNIRSKLGAQLCRKYGIASAPVEYAARCLA